VNTTRPVSGIKIEKIIVGIPKKDAFAGEMIIVSISALLLSFCHKK